MTKPFAEYYRFSGLTVNRSNNRNLANIRAGWINLILFSV